MTKTKTRSRYKDFGSPVEELPDAPAFDLYGEGFTCYPALQGSALIKFISDVDSEEGGRAASAIVEMFKTVLPPDEHKKFEELVNDPKRIVPVETLIEIINWLIEEYTKRPTKPPKPSSPGRSRSGPTSEEDASSSED